MTLPIPTLETIRFGEYLLERRAITDGEYLDAVADHFANGGRFGTALVRRGILAAADIERHAAEYHALQVVEIPPSRTLR